MLESGDSFARALVSRQKSRVHNSFLYAMLSHQGLVRPALQVFGDMLHDELWEPNADGSTSASQRTPCHPEPSIYTYGVLLEGLSRRKEMTMMNQIMKIMEENHLKPNLVTMNTHIKSQAMAQNVSTVVTLMQSLEARGFEPDQFTLDAFGKLHDKHKKRALRMMQRIIDAKSKLLRQQEISQEPATP
jgi:pentatricopeptide repeat protein